MDKDRAGKAGVGDRQRTLRIVPDGINNRNELRLDTALGEREVDRREHLRRRRFDRSMRADDAAHERGVNGGGSTLAADISDDEPEPRHRVGNEIVEIAADGTGGNKFGGHVEMRQFGIRLGEQAALQLASQRQIALQAALLPFDLFVQARIFERNGNLRRQRRHGSLMFFGKESAARMLEVEHAYDLAFVDERYR